jgi:hypothetical protein
LVASVKREDGLIAALPSRRVAGFDVQEPPFAISARAEPGDPRFSCFVARFFFPSSAGVALGRAATAPTSVVASFGSELALYG